MMWPHCSAAEPPGRFRATSQEAQLMRDLRELFTQPGSSIGPLGRLEQIP
jgi:hypothetical protein